MKMSKGNSKIGKIANVSLTPVKACKGCADVCGKDCYALKAYKQYPATKAAWDHNYEQATSNMSAFFSELEESLRTYKGQFFRWHVAGDILNTEYFYEMIVIAKKFPDIKFLAFTKQYWFVNRFINQYEKKGYYYELPENLTIIFSAWPGLEMNNPFNFSIAYMNDGTEDRLKGDEIECPGNCESCGMCWNLPAIGKNVVFNKH